MDFSLENLTDRFLRTVLDPFSTRDIQRFCMQLGLRISEREAKTLLAQSPYVYMLTDGSYITRAGVFSRQWFSIRPTAQEVAKGVFVAGDRCIPFVDDELSPSNLTFIIDGRELQKKVCQFDSDFAIDLYQLYGEEYAPQYIASDPANSDVDYVSRNFELSTSVNLTCVDIGYLETCYGFVEGDRLVCRVTDWDAGVVEIKVLHSHTDVFEAGPVASARLDWYDLLEKKLLESFDSAGPCSTIAEQLEIVFFDNRSKLCVPECGSIEEFLARYSKKVGLEHYGVETRLWRKGEMVPAIGVWNDAELALYDDFDFITMETRAIYSTPDCIFDEFLRDMYFSRKNNLEELFDYIYGSDYSFSRKQRSRLLLHLSERNDILQQSYNWFADQKKGPVRHETLDLYRQVSTLAYRIECSHGKLEKYPQQELVILSQLNTHLLRMIMSFETDSQVENDAEALMMSLEGMRYTFEDIEDALESAFETQRLRQFKVRT